MKCVYILCLPSCITGCRAASYATGQWSRIRAEHIRMYDVLINTTSCGFPSNSFTLFSHSCTLCGFCLNRTLNKIMVDGIKYVITLWWLQSTLNIHKLGYLLSKNGRRSMRLSNLANRSSRSKSSVKNIATIINWEVLLPSLPIFLISPPLSIRALIIISSNWAYASNTCPKSLTVVTVCIASSYISLAYTDWCYKVCVWTTIVCVSQSTCTALMSVDLQNLLLNTSIFWLLMFHIFKQNTTEWKFHLIPL